MTTVVIPWAGADPDRMRVRRWVIERWTLTYPEWRVVIGYACESDDWCKADAVMPTVDGLPNDEVVIVADADVWSGWVSIAVGRVQGGDVQWAVPHRQLRRLNEEATARVLAGEDWQHFDQPDHLAEQLRVGVPGGGMVIARAAVLKNVPLDPRFRGWGQEDHSWGLALRTLVGEPYRPKPIAPMAHLWHPPAPRLNRTWGSRRGTKHYRRYLQADGDIGAMLALIREIDRPAVPAPPIHA